MSNLRRARLHSSVSLVKLVMIVIFWDSHDAMWANDGCVPCTSAYWNKIRSFWISRLWLCYCVCHYGTGWTLPHSCSFERIWQLQGDLAGPLVEPQDGCGIFIQQACVHTLQQVPSVCQQSNMPLSVAINTATLYIFMYSHTLDVCPPHPRGQGVVYNYKAHNAMPKQLAREVVSKSIARPPLIQIVRQWLSVWRLLSSDTVVREAEVEVVSRIQSCLGCPVIFRSCHTKSLKCTHTHPITTQYSAVDTSPLSKYVTHPFWNAVVEVR